MTALVVPAAAAAVYLIIHLALPLAPVDMMVRTYIFQPLLWGLLILAVRFLPAYRPPGKERLRNNFIFLAAGIAFLQIILYVIGGLFSGFGKNPASLTATGITANLFLTGAMLVGIELSRAFLVNRSGNKNVFLTVTLASLLFTALGIPLKQLTGFQPDMQSVSLAMSSWLPLLAENLLASLLVMTAGARASLAYRGMLAAFWWLCPVLPDINWVFKGLFGAAVPVLGMMLVNSYYTQEARRGTRGKKSTRGSTLQGGWIAASLACVVIVWFAVGIFPFQPQLVGSGSMSPALKTGDIAIVAKMPASRISEGDIIQFRSQDNTTILHRVVGTDQSTDQGSFITRGDANSAEDPEPVRPENVIGKVVFNVPAVGLVSIFIKNIFSGGG